MDYRVLALVALVCAYDGYCRYTQQDGDKADGVAGFEQSGSVSAKQGLSLAPYQLHIEYCSN